MKNCHDDMLAFHNERVNLSSSERKEMRDRRNSNRNRLQKGLSRDDEPAPSMLRSQGSYAMWTMVQYKNKDYDIDDGVYFEKEALKGPRGGNRTPRAVKEMVRKAVHHDKFNEPPTVRTNCVRVQYNAGYHVDLPVYRVIDGGKSTERYELASSDWTESDPSSVTRWFREENKSQSPNLDDGGQLRRITRFLKTFARSRASWKRRIASGFIITKLVTERYSANDAREDLSLYNSMISIRNRLNGSLEVRHPTIDSEYLTKGWNDATTRFLREKLSDAIENLEVLRDTDCTLEKARKAWDKVFNTDFFSDRPDNDGSDNGNGGKATSAAILIKGGEDQAAQDAVDKRGGGTYA